MNKQTCKPLLNRPGIAGGCLVEWNDTFGRWFGLRRQSLCGFTLCTQFRTL